MTRSRPSCEPTPAVERAPWVRRRFTVEGGCGPVTRSRSWAWSAAATAAGSRAPGLFHAERDPKGDGR